MTRPARDGVIVGMLAFVSVFNVTLDLALIRPHAAGRYAIR
jgi:hypothetical protein